MNHDGVARANFQRELTDRFEKRQALNVPRRAADFRDENVSRLFTLHEANACLDLVGDMRNHLHGLAQVIAPALPRDDGFVNLSARQAVVPGEHTVREPLVMSEIQVGLGSVVQHVYLAVLERIHRARIHV